VNILRPRVILRVSAGNCTTSRRELAWGTPVPPFSVGSAGEWAIFAPGVAEIQLFLAFDGYRLHAAAASPVHAVTIQGQPLGVGWTHLEVPSVIAFGSASISVEGEDGRAESPPRRPHSMVDLSRPDKQPTQVMDLSQTLKLRTVRLEVSESMLAELRGAPPAPAAAPVEQRVTPSGREYVQSGDTLSFQPAPVATLTFPVPSSLARTAREELSNTLYDGGALRERALQLAGSREPDRESAAPVVHSGSPEPPEAGALRRGLRAFRRSSVVKQLTIALFPLAIAGVWGMQDGSAAASSERSRPPHAPASASKPASSAQSIEASPAASQTPAMAPVAPASSSEPLEMPGTPSDASDASERAALIAAFSGNKVEAAQIYERLARDHHSRTFALAARFIEEDRVRKP